MIIYTIIHNGEKKRWVQLTGMSDDYPNGTGWTLVDKFNRLCILDKDWAEAFISKPATDERYEMLKFKLSRIK